MRRYHHRTWVDKYGVPRLHWLRLKKGGVEITLFLEHFSTTVEAHMILLTDPNKESHESFSWAMPQGFDSCAIWWREAKKHDSYVMGVATASRIGEDERVDMIVLFPTDEQSDDDVLTAAAHLRVSEKYEGMIFAVRPGPVATKQQMYLAAVNGGYTTIEDLEDPAHD